MEKNEKIIDSDELLKDLTVQSEINAFSSSEMVACKKCGRKSPPNRAKCLYCGEAFESTQINRDLLKPNLRKLENWENGINLIYQFSEQSISEEVFRDVSNLIGLEIEILKKIAESGENLPIVRLESQTEAEIIGKKLSDKGIRTTIVSDENLQIKVAPTRLRKLEFNDESLILTLFNTNETVEVLQDELSLIVCGSIYQKKMETVEKYEKSKENKMLSVGEVSKDEKIIDIYIKNNEFGYRIFTSGFDFSFLGKEMSFLAVENMLKLPEKLKSFAPNSKISENYDRIRPLLREVWEIEEIKDSGGISHKGIGKLNINKMTTVSNLSQFTKFSRLQRQLL